VEANVAAEDKLKAAITFLPFVAVLRGIRPVDGVNYVFVSVD